MITQKLSQEIFETKYMINGEKSIDEVFRGVAYAIAQAETDESIRGRVSDDFYEEMKEGRLLPAGRILANARLNCKMPYFNNCYTIDVEDSMEGITTALAQYMKILKTGGGVGFNLSDLRPYGTPISTGGVGSGPMSFAEIFDSACHTISTAGGRRGATMFILDASHPDIEEFITYKMGDENKKLRQMNISVGASDAFIAAVEEDTDWDLTWKGAVIKTIRAKDLMDKIIQNNYDYAEPGLLFKDNAQSRNNLHYMPEMEMKVTNP